MENRYTKDNKYYQETIIPCYDADASFHLKPAAFMDLAQELAYWAAGELGFGFDDLQTHGTAACTSASPICPSGGTKSA